MMAERTRVLSLIDSEIRRHQVNLDFLRTELANHPSHGPLASLLNSKEYHQGCVAALDELRKKIEGDA